MPGFRNGARALTLAPFLLALAAAPAGAANDLPVTVAVEGTQIVAHGRDGAALAPEALAAPPSPSAIPLPARIGCASIG
jgi:hypothetical protein